MDESELTKAHPARRTERAKAVSSPRGGGPAEMGHALEVLRVATTFFVVLYHVALTYVAMPLRLTLWAAYDSAGHVAFDHFVYWVNGFAMPVFFLAAGVSAPAACESRGPRVFLTHRAMRLLRPLLFGCLTVVPFFYLIWGYGLMETGRCDLDSILNWRFRPQVRQNLYGFGHLWFLEYMFLVCVLWCGGWTLRRFFFREPKTPEDQAGWVSRVLASPWKPLLLAIPTAVIFLVDSDTMLRVDNVIVPNVSRLLHYALFFTVGGWISKIREPKAQFIPHSALYLALSFVVFALMSPLLLAHAAAPLGGVARVVFCLLAALFPWLTVFGGLGVLLKVIQGRGAVMRFLSEASFWVYIVHVPLVALMQVLLLRVALPAPVKFLAISAVAISLSLVSYELIVRRSLIGEIINGARKRSPKRGILGPEFGWVATLAVIVLMFAGAAWESRVFFWGHNCHEEVPGQLYRSARLKERELDALIQRKGLRSVVTFTGGGEAHLWIAAQKRLCEARRVGLHVLALRADRAPTRNNLIRLMDVLERCPRPLLVQGYRGIDHTGFASAVALLLGGAPPRAALREFDLKYGQFGGPEHSPLGQVVLDYERSLNARHESHSPSRFQAWVREEYVVRPTPPPDAGPAGNLMARGNRGPAFSR